MERSGTGWDEIYYSEMQELNIAGKKVAVFGLGDSVSYSENYADATGEVRNENSIKSRTLMRRLFYVFVFYSFFPSKQKITTRHYYFAQLHDVFEALGCKMVGYTSTEGYLHDESKSIRGDQFCGLLLDAVNQEELTEGRVQKWVADLIAGGILESGGAASSSSTSSSSVAAPVAVPLIEVEEVASPVVEVVPSAVSENCVGFAAHYNPRSDKTMWISNDGRSSYVTAGAP